MSSLQFLDWVWLQICLFELEIHCRHNGDQNMPDVGVVIIDRLVNLLSVYLINKVCMNTGLHLTEKQEIENKMCRFLKINSVDNTIYI